MRRLAVIFPVALFAGLIGVMVALLTNSERNDNLSRLPSPLIGRMAPEFSLPAVDASVPGGFSTEDLKGRATVVNVFASWCVPCLAEHPVIERLAAQGVPVYGINHRDKPEAATNWLRRHGNPYTAVGADPDARASLDWGVTGVPETFIIDNTGTIRYKHVGPITPEILNTVIVPIIKKVSQ